MNRTFGGRVATLLLQPVSAETPVSAAKAVRNERRERRAETFEFTMSPGTQGLMHDGQRDPHARGTQKSVRGAV